MIVTFAPKLLDEANCKAGVVGVSCAPCAVMQSFDSVFEIGWTDSKAKVKYLALYTQQSRETS